MKNIIKLFNRGLLFAIVSGGASLAFSVSLHAGVGDEHGMPFSSGYSIESVECTDEIDRDHRFPTDCISVNKVALNGLTTNTGWELDTAKLFSYTSDVDKPNSNKSLETPSTDRASVVLTAQPDPEVLTEVAPKSSASLSLEENMRGNVDNTGDSAISEPLLTSILALIAIVAVARRNVSGS